jgi:ring-1,2-phenylacetyl-CoA epoxidase subunit PaaE
MNHFHKLKVAAIGKETNDCVQIELAVPTELQAAFQFIQGQNLAFKTTINGEAIRRSYSICTAPHENKLCVAVKKVVQGIFSSYANDVLKVGDELEVFPPTGKFNTKLNAENKKHYVAFAAGSGITPIISIIKATLHQEPNSHFTLIYGNQNRSSIIFKEQLEALKNQFVQRFSLLHILSRERMDAAINYGRIDAEKCQMINQKLLPFAQADAFFICGPEQMIFCVKDFLEQQNVPKEKIHFELFVSSSAKKETVKQTKAEIDAAPKSKVTIKLDGTSIDIDVPLQGDSILDMALQSGADLPFACKGGVCCTCRAKLISGQVKMDVVYGLEPDEIAQGFILTCQSHPITETVVIDYDVK